MRLLLLLVASLPFVFALNGCEGESQKIGQSIVGDWELTKGFRNHKETESLAGTNFHFGPDGKMTTNLPVGIESPTDFEIDENIISQKGRQTLKYVVKSVSDSTLVLVFEMRGLDFELQFRKFKPLLDSIPAQELGNPVDDSEK